MRTFKRTASAITLDRDGLALSQTPAGAGALTLTANTTLTPPRPVAIYSGGNIAARVFTIVGTDRKGSPITDTVTGVNASTVPSNKLFATVTSISIDAAAGSAVEAGWTATSYTSWIHLGSMSRNYQWTMRTFLAVGATATYDIEATSQNMNRDQVAGEYPDDLVTLASAQTGNVTSYNLSPWAAVRIKVTAQTGDVGARVLPTVNG